MAETEKLLSDVHKALDRAKERLEGKSDTIQIVHVSSRSPAPPAVPDDPRNRDPFYSDLIAQKMTKKEPGSSRPKKAKRARGSDDKEEEVKETDWKGEDVQQWLRATLYPLLLDMALFEDLDMYRETQPDSAEPVNDKGWTFTKTPLNGWQGPPITPDNQKDLHEFMMGTDPSQSRFRLAKNRDAISTNFCPAYLHRSLFVFDDLVASVTRGLADAEVVWERDVSTQKPTIRGAALHETNSVKWSGGFIVVVDDSGGIRQFTIASNTLSVTEAVLLIAACAKGPLRDTGKYGLLALGVLNAIRHRYGSKGGVRQHCSLSSYDSSGTVVPLNSLVCSGTHWAPLMLRVIGGY
jgi:hypothetical protein